MEEDFITIKRVKGLVKNHEVVNLDTYKISKPIVLVLGGNGILKLQMVMQNSCLVGLEILLKMLIFFR